MRTYEEYKQMNSGDYLKYLSSRVLAAKEILNNPNVMGQEHQDGYIVKEGGRFKIDVLTAMLVNDMSSEYATDDILKKLEYVFEQFDSAEAALNCEPIILFQHLNLPDMIIDIHLDEFYGFSEVSHYVGYLSDLIVILNDEYGWSFDQIAEFLSRDHDLDSFKFE